MMRQMEVPPFRDEITISDLENLYKHRLGQTVVLWPNQAIPLLGYMCWPNDPAARDELMLALRNWSNGSRLVPPGLGRIQHEWLRVANILHEHYDLDEGQHQQRRGGPSIGKAITLVAATAKSRGTRPVNLWKLWKKYKDVAHLVTAAALVCADVRASLRNKQMGPFGPSMLRIQRHDRASPPYLRSCTARAGNPQVRSAGFRSEDQPRLPSHRLGSSPN